MMKMNEGYNLTKNFLKKTVEYVFTFGQLESEDEVLDEKTFIKKKNSEKLKDKNR
jgi:hypothetical protein